jgi:hypothetical protein
MASDQPDRLTRYVRNLLSTTKMRDEGVDAFAELGRERNGIFAREDHNDPDPSASPGRGSAAACPDDAFAPQVPVAGSGGTARRPSGGATF